MGLCGSAVLYAGVFQRRSEPHHREGGFGGGNRDGTSERACLVGISTSLVSFVSGLSITRVPWPADTAYKRPLAFCHGFCLLVETWSCMNEWSVPQSHMVMTALRSMPCGRGGATGVSPLPMRSVHSENILSAKGRFKLLAAPLMPLPRTPVWRR